MNDQGDLRKSLASLPIKGVAYSPTEKSFLAVDVGGSSVKLGHAHAGDLAVDLTTVPIGQLAGGGDVVASIVATIVATLATVSASTPITRIGMVVPGIVDEAAGIARLSVLLGWRDVPFRAIVEDATGLPVTLGHDVSAAAMAEGRWGAARGHTDWLLLALGTGLGSSFVLAGRPYRGANGYGGELSHVVVDPNGPDCPCGKRGCLETLASASGLVARYKRMAPQRVGEISAAEIAARARGGEPVALHVWDTAIEALAWVTAGYVDSHNPSLVVIGGGMAAAGKALLAPFERQLLQQLAFAQPKPTVKRAALGVFAGAHGAALLAALDDVCLAPFEPPDSGLPEAAG